MALFMSKFVMRQTPGSRFSHWDDIDEKGILLRVRANWKKQKKGYREGVVLVPVEPEGFFTSVVTLKPGDKLRGVSSPVSGVRNPGSSFAWTRPSGAVSDRTLIAILDASLQPLLWTSCCTEKTFLTKMGIGRC